MYNLNLTGDMFIIPNCAAKYENSYFKDRFEKINKKWRADPQTTLVQMWYVVPGSDNLTDHGYTFTIDDKQYRIRSGEVPGQIPLSLIENLKEGESVTARLQVNAYEYRSNSKEEFPVNLTLTLTARQKKYRYRNFGEFEFVLKSIIA